MCVQAAIVAVMEGWVSKKAMTARKNKWEKRYMVLKGDVLAYYGSEKDARAGKSAKKALTLNHSSTVKRPAYFHADEFEVTVGAGKVLYAVSELKEDSERWVAAINAVIAEKQAEAAASELRVEFVRSGYLIAFSTGFHGRRLLPECVVVDIESRVSGGALTASKPETPQWYLEDEEAMLQAAKHKQRVRFALIVTSLRSGTL
jgi:hypothetical protein